MQVHHAAAARAFMQVVDVLRDQREALDLPGHRGNRAMAGVGQGTHREHATPFVPAPHQLRVACEGLGRGQFERVEAGPQAGHRVTEGGNTALGRRAGAGHHHDVVRFAHAGREFVHRCMRVSGNRAIVAHPGFDATSGGRVRTLQPAASYV